MHKLLVYIEQYDVVGILPSQLESLALLNSAMGVAKAAYIDNTADGFKGVGGFSRYGNINEFLSVEKGPFVLFSPTNGEDIRTIQIPDNSWLVFGPSRGFNDEMLKFENMNVKWARVPGGEMNSRDVVPIVLWEVSKWQE
jgi:hypothetical protein